nr:hypothetical protein [uncultured Pedobacter sp.]
MEGEKKPALFGNILKDISLDRTLDSELKNLDLARNHLHIKDQLVKLAVVKSLAHEVIEDYEKNKHLDDPLKRAGMYKRMISELEECLMLLDKER